MKKFLLIILILVLLLIIYIFSFKENFSSNNFDLTNIGLDNLDKYSPIKCSVNTNTDSEDQSVNDDYSISFKSGKKFNIKIVINVKYMIMFHVVVILMDYYIQIWIPLQKYYLD